MGEVSLQEDGSVASVVKPGWKTTEFWMTAILGVATAVMTSGLFPETSIVLKVAMLAATTLSLLGYQVGRSIVKK